MNKVYAFSDIHGNYSLWTKIKNYIDETDIIFFLGDAIDRGPKGYDIMKEILADKRFIYLKGNHEDMMMRALVELHKGYDDYNFDLWTVYNGGWSTYNSWEDDGCNYDYWIEKLRRLPLEDIYINAQGQTVLLSHAGYTPGRKTPDEYQFIWNREHFWTDIDDSMMNSRVVHGHTPVDYLKVELAKDEYEDHNGILFYKSIKIDIDSGTYHSHQISLLDLDTWENIIFKEG